MRILVIEDEPKVARALRDGLVGEHHAVEVAPTGEDGFFRLQSAAFDLVLLDLLLPGRDGLEVLRTLRAQGVTTPVLILTARDTVADRVAGLDAGADDYLVKPFAFPELLARVRALVRRGRPDDVLRLQHADLELDLVTRTVRRGARPITCTPRELQLLECLLRHAGHAVSRETLARDVLQESARSAPVDNLLDVHVARLRKKIDGADDPRLIHTVRGVGFALRAGAP